MLGAALRGAVCLGGVLLCCCCTAVSFSSLLLAWLGCSSTFRVVLPLQGSGTGLAIEFNRAAGAGVLLSAVASTFEILSSLIPAAHGSLCRRQSLARGETALVGACCSATCTKGSIYHREFDIVSWWASLSV